MGIGTGRAKGWITAACAGGRIAGTDGQPGLSYLPAHTINGKPYSQRVTFTVYINSTKGVGRDGTPGRSDRFQLVAYNALADSLCRSMKNGQAIDAVLKPHSYQGRSFDANRVMRLEADGTPVMVEKVGFQIVESPTYGEDAQKTIDQEIAAGRRPVNWNIANHADNAIWTQMLKDRANVQYVPGSKVFGYARVLPLTGVGVVQIAQAATGPAAKAAAILARAGGVVPVVTTAVAVPATPPVAAMAAVAPAVDQTQLAALIAEVLAAKNATTETVVTGAAVGAEGIDQKTGFTKEAF